MSERLANIERLLQQQQVMPPTLLQNRGSEIGESEKNEVRKFEQYPETL